MKDKIITKQAVRQVLRDYWQEYKKVKWTAFFSFIFPAIGQILVFFIPPLIIGNLINAFVESKQISFAVAGNSIAFFGGLWLLGEIFWRLGFHFLIRLETSGIANLSKIGFQRLSERDYEFYANNFVGSLTKKANSFFRNFEPFTDALIFNVTTNFFPVVFVLIILWRYSPYLSLILVACLLLAIFIAVPFIRKRQKLIAARHEANSRIVGRLSDSLTNMLAVKSFAKEKEEREVYGEYVDDLAEKFKKAADYHNLNLHFFMSPFYVATNVIGLIAVIFFSGKLSLPPGTVIVVFSYYAQVTRIFWEINRIYRELESSVSEASEFTELLINPPAIEDVKGAKELKVRKAEISFNQANFKYPSDQRNSQSFFNDFNLHIKSKEKVGLVGPSGGGKTTITKLLLRFIDLQGGSITIDGQDLKEITQKSLRENISYVPQEPLLFHRTLFENIAYGNEKATEEDVIKAAKLAYADDFISELPQGYLTLVGERGIKLSGGQRQRVAIARAILKNSPILVLDEATSSLDSESEKYIQKGLWQLMKQKTALVIAHRLSTIKHLDRIIVLDNGKIVEDGTHEELIKKKGLYAKLWSHQSGEFL